jgi:alpha-ketoglutarate-dependent taurine dioxygenase
MAFLGMALLQNLRVLLHTDNADDKHGFVIMTPFGKFTGGHLLVGSWSIQYRMEYQPGDVVIFNSGILPHAITPFEGTRQAVVLFSHEEMFKFGL